MHKPRFSLEQSRADKDTWQKQKKKSSLKNHFIVGFKNFQQMIFQKKKKCVVHSKK